MNRLGILTVVLLAATPLVAASGGATGEAAPMLGISAFGGYGSYAMSDVNDLVDRTNELFTGLGLKMDPLNSGANVGLGVELRISPTLAVSMEYERLAGATSVGAEGASVEYGIPANAVLATLKGYLLSSGSVRFGLGGGVGYYDSSGSAKFSIPNHEGLSEDWSGSTLGFHGLGLLDYEATPSFHLGLQAGYRYAKVTDVDTVLPAIMGMSQSKLDLDWSGLMTRFAFTVYLASL
jgi:hypothetical protein